MAHELRILGSGDEAALDTFLQTHAASSLFLRSNMRAAGLVDTGRPLAGTYAARMVDGRVEGVVGLFWNGNLILQAPAGGTELARLAIPHSNRAVKGIIGPWDQAVAVRDGLGLSRMPTLLDSREDLFSLTIASMRLPQALTSGEVSCRSSREAELPLLSQWRHDYYVETTHDIAGTELLERSATDVRLAHERGAMFVLEAGDRLVSMLYFNARIPDCVQIGGVWTPPALRGRGYARAVVAGALVIAQREGVTSSVLFTDENNIAARTAYLSIGYERIGNYAITLFRDGQCI